MDWVGIVVAIVAIVILDLILGVCIFMFLFLNKVFSSAWIIVVWPVVLIIMFVLWPFEAYFRRREERRNGHPFGSEYTVIGPLKEENRGGE